MTSVRCSLRQGTDPWVAVCEAMLEDEMDSGRDRSYHTDSSVCVAIVYPELPDRDLIRRDALGSWIDTLPDRAGHTLRGPARGRATEGKYEYASRLTLGEPPSISISQRVPATPLWRRLRSTSPPR